MPKRRLDRPKKRRFYGNKYTKQNNDKKHIDEDITPKMDATTSEKKLNIETVNQITSKLCGYRFFDLEMLLLFLNSFPCPRCREVGGYNVREFRRGLQSQFYFSCTLCEYEIRLSNSYNEHHSVSPINIRFLVSMYNIGRNYQQCKRFLANMNMPQIMSKSNWQKIVKYVHGAYETVAMDSLSSAAEELANVTEGPEPKEVIVSCDNTWQRRGFQSKNGVSTVLSVSKDIPSKVIDVHVSSTYCNSCVKMKNKFETWYNDHKVLCEKNHDGTAGSMEPAGMNIIFRRSINIHNLMYTGYLGDGDSKSYHQIASANPPIYINKKIRKLECCGHVQKRMGKKLMDKVKEMKNKTFVENGKNYRGISGKGKLTQAAIKRIQGHYGAAIRNNVGDVVKMKKDIWAIFKHRGGNHEDCGNWCPAHSGNLEKANKNMLPLFVLNQIKPVFENLAATELLKKCSHGGTQNNNESLHHLIWQRCPKEIFVNRRRLELAVYDALITFNDGDLGRLSVFERLGLEKGEHCLQTFQVFDHQRCLGAKKAASEKNKLKRKQKSLNISSETTVDNSYIAGGF